MHKQGRRGVLRLDGVSTARLRRRQRRQPQLQIGRLVRWNRIWKQESVGIPQGEAGQRGQRELQGRHY